MAGAGNNQKSSAGAEILKLGRMYMKDAGKSEMESDYIAAEGIYHMCCDLFSSLIQQKSSYETEAKGEYMHVLFRYAMLPQIKEAEKMQYLDQAFELAAQLEQETGDVEYTIAAGCIQEEMEGLDRDLKHRLREKQEEALLF